MSASLCWVAQSRYEHTHHSGVIFSHKDILPPLGDGFIFHYNNTTVVGESNRAVSHFVRVAPRLVVTHVEKLGPHKGALKRFKLYAQRAFA